MRYLCFALLFCLLLPLQASEPQHITIAKSYLYVREKTGKNDGEPIETWQRYVNIPKGSSYCAAFVSWCIGQAKAIEPKIRTSLAQGFITKKSIKAIDVFKGKVKVPDYSTFVMKKGTTIHGHTGFVIHWIKANGSTIEANTSSGSKGGQSDGDGVYLRNRAINPYSYFRITHFTRVIY